MTLLLQDEEWAAWSDREIARRCSVTHNLVGAVRESILGKKPSMSERTFTHHKTGAPATMKTENIGRSGGGPKRPETQSYKSRELSPL